MWVRPVMLSPGRTQQVSRRSCVEERTGGPRESLRRLALHDEQCIQSLLGIRLNNDKTAGLEPKAHALVRLAALIALGASCVSYGWAVEVALAAGATADEIVAPWSRWRLSPARPGVAATPAVACSLGYDLDWRSRNWQRPVRLTRKGLERQRSARLPGGTARFDQRCAVNLSDFRSKLISIFASRANCCQSLLLDPDATILIDLHKRLFLLSRRGDSPGFSLP